jgi:predicted flavoprotein YhiN
LQISSYWQHGEPLHIDLLPACDMATLLDEQKGAKLLSNFLRNGFPRASPTRGAQLPGIENKPLNQYNDKQRKRSPRPCTTGRSPRPAPWATTRRR